MEIKARHAANLHNIAHQARKLLIYKLRFSYCAGISSNAEQIFLCVQK